MNWVPVLSALIAGFILGLGAAVLLRLIHAKTAKDFAAEMKDSFGNLSLEALSKASEELIKLGSTDLDSKKGLIDQQLGRMTEELDSMSKLMKELEKDRVEKFGELTNQLKTTSEQTALLKQTTESLREALSSTKARGQWGERMAEDVLRLAGFVENVNYFKQKSIEGIGSRPDFTFPLPRDLKVNMDVKFPLDNYVRFLEAKSDLEKEKLKNDFLRDVKARIKEVTTREYIDPEQNTVDYVLLFIPNEQIYAFIHEQDSSILDDGIKNRVIFCSPITFFAVLAVIRQAVENFALEKTSNQILSLFGSFRKQWNEFIKRFDNLGKRIEDTQKEYEGLVTTRRRQLERPLNKIEDLRKERGIPVDTDNDERTLPGIEEPEENKAE